MNRSISKIRHIQNLNARLEKRIIREQEEDVMNLPDVEVNAEKFKELPEVTIEINKFKEKINNAIDSMESVIDSLEEIENEENLQDMYDAEVRQKVNALIKTLGDLNAVEFKPFDNPFGI